MRISQEEKRLFVDSVTAVDPESRVWLFGSRVEDAKRGGDIDLAVLSTRIGRQEMRGIRRKILDRLGEQRIDIVTSSDGAEPFFRMAVEEGVALNG